MKWKVVAGFPNYEISENGEVRKLTSTFRKKAGELISPFMHTQDYLRVMLHRDGKRFSVFVHQLVAKTFLGPRPDKHEVCHKDGCRTNNNVSNLRYGTRKENHADMKNHGTAQVGRLNGNSKLSDEDVSRIREARLFGARLKDLAGCYGVTEALISMVALRKAWKHVA